MTVSWSRILQRTEAELQAEAERDQLAAQMTGRRRSPAGADALRRRGSGEGSPLEMALHCAFNRTDGPEPGQPVGDHDPIRRPDGAKPRRHRRASGGPARKKKNWNRNLVAIGLSVTVVTLAIYKFRTLSDDAEPGNVAITTVQQFATAETAGKRPDRLPPLKRRAEGVTIDLDRGAAARQAQAERTEELHLGAVTPTGATVRLPPNAAAADAETDDAAAGKLRLAQLGEAALPILTTGVLLEDRPTPAASSPDAPTRTASLYDEIDQAGRLLEAQRRAIPQASPRATVSRAEETSMLRRALTLLEHADVAAARLLFEHLAMRGSAAAAFAMGQTFDPDFLKLIYIKGIRPDSAKASEWYRKAADLGHGDAENRLRRPGLVR